MLFELIMLYVDTLSLIIFSIFDNDNFFVPKLLAKHIL